MSPDLLAFVADLQTKIQEANSPWRTREGAAAYLGCSVDLIDKLAAKGILARRYLVKSPRFKTSDLDRVVMKEKIDL